MAPKTRKWILFLLAERRFPGITLITSELLLISGLFTPGRAEAEIIFAELRKGAGVTAQGARKPQIIRN